MTSKPQLKRRGPKAAWLDKIDAPPLALALYEMIGGLQYSDAFRGCHVYTGARDGKSGRPMFKFEKRVHAMPYIISSFMGIEYGKRTCNTPGCVNPFHYSPPSERITPDLNHFVMPESVGVDWLDLIDYYVEEVGIKAEFSALREAIPAEDIDDSNLRHALPLYLAKKESENL